MKDIERVSFTYNSSGKIAVMSIDEWDGTIWEKSSKQTITWDANENAVTVLTEQWDIPTSTWNKLYRNIYSYDFNNNIASIVEQYWNIPVSD